MTMIGSLVSFAYMIGLFVISSLPDTARSENILSAMPSLMQNLLHVPAFGVLTLLWMMTLKGYRVGYRPSVLLSVGIAMLYGAGLELYQATVPGRFSSMGDMMLNLIGVFLSVFIYNTFKRRNIMGAFKW